MLSKSDKSRSMSDTAFVQDALKDVYTVERFGSVKAAQTEAYDFLRRHVRQKPLTFRRVRSFFEGKAKIIRGEEKDAVRIAQIEEARNEQRQLRERLARLDRVLSVVDEEFHSETLAALRQQAGGPRRVDLPRTEG